MKTKVIMMAAALMTATATYAADVEVDIGAYSHYIWRGMTLDNRPVLQGGVTVSSTNSGFYGNVWGNYSLDDGKSGEEGLNEVDYTVGYAGSYEIFDYDVGYIYYSFPNTDFDSTAELYVGVALNNLAITPSVYAYYDFDEADGFYVIGDLNYGTDITEALSMEVGASLAWASEDFNEFYHGRETDSVSDMTVYTGLSYALTDKLSLSGSLNYTFFPDSGAKDAAKDSYSYDSNIYGGVSLAYAF
jgi:hypothetical protein